MLKSPFKVCLGYLPQNPLDLEFTVSITLQTSKEKGAIERAQYFLEGIQ